MTARVRRGFALVAPVLTAGLVHVAVIAFDFVPWLAAPIDGGRQFRGRALLGRNKTWRGFVVMPLATAVTVSAQQALAAQSPRIAALAPLVRGAPPPWVVGAACGAAYVLAEIPNSFVKRRLGIAAGARAGRAAGAQYVVDQLDSVLGCVAAVRWFYRIDAGDALVAGVLGGAFHVGVERAMRVLPRRHRARR